MSTLAASTSAYHLTLRNSFYQKTRQALESLDQRGNADAVDTENVQAWLLLAVYELMCVGFRHAWISAGRAFRLIQLDPTWTTAVGSAADDNTSSPHQEYWVEAEQRRRTFWFAYCLDRFLSLRNGSSLTFSERVPVRLPCPESAFQYGESVVMGFLPDVNTMASAEASAQMSPLGECIVVATLAGHVLSHRLQATASSASGGERQDTQQNNDFWDRHTWLDSLVAHRIDIFAMNHPPAAQERDPMLLFLAMEWHAAELYLWHTAESMSAPAQDQNRAIHAESSQRVEKAAREMIRLMSKLSELNSWKIHPLMSIPLTLGAELLSSRSDLLEEFTQKLKEITQATHGLRLFS
ncbi:hypothetical protein GGR54DRAFT_617247 [Hypoxylon sp. NC1633]|nr:hypothetical protein GGR54DRAFT_617247 [Hypoxylon sp. NC1633]